MINVVYKLHAMVSKSKRKINELPVQIDTKS